LQTFGISDPNLFLIKIQMIHHLRWQHMSYVCMTLV